MSLFPREAAGGSALRRVLEGGLVRAPGCFDALSARVLERAGFQASFLGGFSVSAASLALPDVGLLSYGEALHQARSVASATSLPVIGDADTGYGNEANVERTVIGYARAGLACVMIEDQTWPKRCGHTAGKTIVDRREAVRRVRAAVRAREEYGLDVLVMARTDANGTDGFDEAIWRARAFADAGADLTFLEAPDDTGQMRRYCELVPGWKTANLVEDGRTPWLTPSELEEVGYDLVLYPVSLLLRSMASMQAAAEELAGRVGEPTRRVSFDEARALVGWPEYERRLRGYASEPDPED